MSECASQLDRKSHFLVLVVGSGGAEREIVCRALERDGLIVVEAPYGQDGLARLRQLEPDCLVLDEGLESERHEFLAALREGGELSGSIIAIDAHSTGFLDAETDGVVHLQKNTLSDEGVAAAVRVAVDLARITKENNLLVSRFCESRCHLNAFIRQAPVAIAMFDTEMRHIAYSHKWLDAFGMRADVLGRSLYDVLPRVPEHWRKLHRQALQGESVSRREDLLLSPDGRRQWLAWDASPWRASDQKIGGVLLAVQDITGRRAIEDALETNQAQLEAALASMTESIAIYGADGRLTQFNGGFVRFHRFDDAEDYKKSDPSFLEYYDESGHFVPWSDQPDRRATKGETGIGLVYRLQRKETGAQWFGKYNFGPIRGRGGEIVGAVVTAHDVTEEKRADEARREAERRKDEFLAVLAHELRNPLAPIHNAVEVLRRTEDAPAEKRRTMLDMMERQVRHLVRLVDDLIEISRIERDKIELRRERCELASILQNAVETAQPLVEQNRHNVGLHLPADKITLLGDPVRLVQIFANLVNNAAKYTPPGGAIEIRAERRGDEIVVVVRDNGVGIPPESLPHVFDLFMQGDSSRRVGGLGIGLALTCKLVQLHGGSIEAKSEGQDKGSEFIVRLPLQPSVPQTASPAKARGKVSDRPIRALVIDDDLDVGNSLGILLSTLGAEVRVVYDGPSGVDAVRDFAPEIVFIDLGMPGMDGCETARRIRSSQIGRELRLVALTGWGQDEARARTKEAGFDAHLIKPASLEALEQALQRDAQA